jgi:hypothetical protein
MDGAGLELVKKLLLNSTILTHNARWVSYERHAIFYLDTPMHKFEYMRIPEKYIPEAIIDQYALAPLIHKKYATSS